LLSGASLACLPYLAAASQLTYTPINPNFGGNPFNGAPLLNEANAQNQYTAKASPTLTTDQLLQQEAESTLISSAANAAFSQAQAGGNSNGNINLGNGVFVSYHPDASNPAFEDIIITEPNGTIFTLETAITSR